MRSAWWVRTLARLPMPVLHGLARFLAWLALHVFPYRQHVILENLRKAFPEMDERSLRNAMRAYYRGCADVLVEVVKAANLDADDIRSRVEPRNLEPVRELLSSGTPVLLVAAHQCNWEWLLLSLSLELGFRVDAAYKPLVNKWAERELLAIRTRFGSRLVP